MTDEEIMNIVTNEAQLRIPTDFVKKGEDISEIVDNLFREMQDHDALGLAANQLGYKKRIFVMNMKPWPPICVVNALIRKNRGGRVSLEGCRSLPGVEVRVKRPQHITLKGVNQYFKPVKYRLKGLHARIACHEIDHLIGKLITDYKEGEKASEQDV